MCSRKQQLHRQRKNTKKHCLNKCAETMLYKIGISKQYYTTKNKYYTKIH